MFLILLYNLKTINFSNNRKKLFLADKLSLFNRTASSGQRENVMPCNFYVKLFFIILFYMAHMLCA